MNFYLPDARLNAQADLVLEMIEERFAARHRAFTGRRIRALIWDDGEQDEIILVGASIHDCQNGEDGPVLLILEDAAEPDLIHLVTLQDAAFGTTPRTLRLDHFWRIVDFDDGPADRFGGPRRVRA